eukprot:1175933-Pleurochrysis_carterae.AAC.3
MTEEICAEDLCSSPLTTRSRSNPISHSDETTDSSTLDAAAAGGAAGGSGSCRFAAAAATPDAAPSRASADASFGRIISTMKSPSWTPSDLRKRRDQMGRQVTDARPEEEAGIRRWRRVSISFIE